MPPPGDVAHLGTMLELQHTMSDGSTIRHSWTQRDAPQLFWSPKQRTLYAFVDVELPAPTGATASGPARRAFRAWTGRTHRSVREVQLPPIQVSRAGQGVHIVYRSNKWGSWTNYIHAFAPGTTVELDTQQPRRAFLVNGPPLRLTPRGLVD